MEYKPRNWKKVGEYFIHIREEGGFLVKGKGSRGNDLYVPSQERVLEKYKKEGETGAVKLYMSWHGLLSAQQKKSLPAGRKYLGLPAKKDKRVKLEDAQKAVRNFWKPKLVIASRENEGITLPSIVDFARKYQRVYHAFFRNKNLGGDLETFLEQIMPDKDEHENKIYKGLYRLIHRIKTPFTSINPETLGERLLVNHNQGNPTNKSGLKNSSDPDDRKMYNQVYVLTQRKYLGHRNFTAVVCELTKLDKDDIVLDRSSKVDLGVISERLLEFVLRFGRITEVDLSDYFPEKPISTKNDDKRFSFSQGIGLSDLRIGDMAIEVKTGLNRFSPSEIEKMVERYTPYRSKWWTPPGREIDESLIVLHRPYESYRKYIYQLRQAGIKTLPRTEFRCLLRKVINKIEQSKILSSKISSELTPRLHNLDYLLRLFDEISLSPYLLTTPKNRARRDWSKQVLKSLVDIAKEIEGEPEDEEEKSPF